MIATVLINSICIKSHNYHFFLEIKIIKIQSLNKFDDYNAVLLSTFIILYMRSLGLIYYLFHICKL